jgi:hypothetical protein
VAEEQRPVVKEGHRPGVLVYHYSVAVTVDDRAELAVAHAATRPLRAPFPAARPLTEQLPNARDMSQSNHTPPARTPEDSGKHSSRVNLTAAAAGALASISAAVVASFLGVAGTLIGAALASVVSSIAGAIYTGVLASTQQRVKRTLRRPGDHETDQETGLRELQELRGDLGHRGRRALRRPAVRWLVVGGVALALFLVAIGTVTGIEAAISKPLASALGGHQEGNAHTSVGAALGGSSKQPREQAPAPSSTTQSPGGVPPRPSGEPAPPSSTTTTTSPPSTTTVAPSAPPSTVPSST